MANSHGCSRGKLTSRLSTMFLSSLYAHTGQCQLSSSFFILCAMFLFKLRHTSNMGCFCTHLCAVFVSPASLERRIDGMKTVAWHLPSCLGPLLGLSRQ